MFASMFMKATGIMDDTPASSGSSFTSPFDKATSMASSAAGKDIRNLAYAAALAGLAFVAIAFSIGGNKMRQMAKAHLPWIFVGIAIAAGIGGVLNWMEATGTGVFGNDSAHFASTILPIIHVGKDYAMNFLPFIK